MAVRNRIKEHRRVRAGELVPHELNWRRHPDVQRRALRALYDEVGFARSLLAYELPDGRLQLIDGHLRRDIDPDMEVEVEILDVTAEEARKLLLSIDGLAGLAEARAAAVERLTAQTRADAPVLNDLWQALARNEAAARAALKRDEGGGMKEEGMRDEGGGMKEGKEGSTGPPSSLIPHPSSLIPSFWVLVECAHEPEQVRLLGRFQGEGLKCRALVS